MSWNERGKLIAIEWAAELPSRLREWGDPSPPPEVASTVMRVMNYFFTGEPIGEIPWEVIDQSGWTDFQREVYRAICRIPHGETRTYGWVAAAIRNVAATRAVGQALRKNPVPILVPCHRVVASNSLGGFMGIVDPRRPELRFKQCLLALEDGYNNPIFPFLEGLMPTQAPTDGVRACTDPASSCLRAL